MSSLPRKSVTGLPLKKYVLDTLNGLIDYLQTHRIKAGRGIDVRETASGYVIGLANSPSNPPQVQSASGDGADGIEASVTGGTASITLTGGTGSVNLVGTGSVNISGNTNTGNIEINATGGTSTFGFPDYSNEVVAHGNIDLTGSTYSYAYPVWLIGGIGMELDANGDVWADINLWVNSSPNQTRIRILEINATAEDNAKIDYLSVPVCVPIPANTPFYFSPNATDMNYCRNDLGIYGCL